MANVDAKFGLKPFKNLGSGNVNSNEYTIATAAAAMYTGDLVEMTGTGRNIQVVAAGNVDSVGVFAGCRYKASDGTYKYSSYWPGSVGATEAVAYVYDDPTTIFEIQADTCAEGDVGALADWAQGSGSTVTGLSGGYCNVSGGTANYGKNLQIMGLAPHQDNAYGAYANVLVLIAQHTYRGDATTSGSDVGV